MVSSIIAFFALYILAFIPGYLILARARSTRNMALGFIPLLIVVFTLPFLIPPAFKLVRFFLFLPLFHFGVKNIDLAFRRRMSPQEPFSFKEYLHALSFSFGGIYTAVRERGRPDVKGGLSYFFSGVYQIAFGMLVIFLNTYLRTPEWSWPISTILKLGCFYWFGSALTDLNFSLCRFLGREVSPVYNEPIRAVSPEDLWSNRINLYMRQYLIRFVFLPLGGPKRPSLGIMVTFLASGIIHEYQFDVASSVMKGYVLTFFAANGLAVVLERKFKRFLRRRHRALYEKASRSPMLPFVLVPAHTAWSILTGAVFLKALDPIIDLFNIGAVRTFLAGLPLPPFPE